jgi:hypothetical protein
MIHNFLDAYNFNDYKNIINFITTNQDFHPLGLFRDNHSKELNFPTLFCGHPNYF